MYFAVAIPFTISSFLGMGYASHFETVLTSQKSMQNWIMWPGFGTNIIGLLHTLDNYSITPMSNIFLASCFTIYISHARIL